MKYYLQNTNNIISLFTNKEIQIDDKSYKSNKIIISLTLSLTYYEQKWLLDLIFSWQNMYSKMKWNAMQQYILEFSHTTTIANDLKTIWTCAVSKRSEVLLH